jgi:hypothetical protein
VMPYGFPHVAKSSILAPSTYIATSYVPFLRFGFVKNSNKEAAWCFNFGGAAQCMLLFHKERRINH